MKHEPIIITGFHRSGTSMVSQLLYRTGLYLGEESEFTTPSNDDNPDGYWEFLAGTDFSDQLLNKLGGTWDHPPLSLQSQKWRTEINLKHEKEQALKVFESLQESGLRWGWKNPRSAVLFPFWKEVFPEAKVIVCLRNPLEAAFSLAKRVSFHLDFMDSLRLWRTSYDILKDALVNVPYLVTHYESYFYAPEEEITRIADFAGLSPDTQLIDQAKKYIKVDLYRATATEQMLHDLESMPAGVIELYEYFGNQAGDTYLRLRDDQAYRKTRHDRALERVFSSAITAFDRLRTDGVQVRNQLTDSRSELLLLQQQLTDARDENKHLIQKLTATQNEQKQYKDEIRRLEVKLRDIAQSRAWRLVERYGRTKNKVKAITRGIFKSPFAIIRIVYQAFLPYSLRTYIWKLRTRINKKSDHGVIHRDAFVQKVGNETSQLPEGKLDVIILAIIEFHGRYQRPQQVSSHFARTGHRVFYISPARFISPSYAPYQTSQIEPNLFNVELATDRTPSIYSSIVDDEHQTSFLQSINALRTDYGIHSALLIVHLPFWTPLALALGEKYGWVINYDCMDEWDGFPLISQPIIEAEQHLVRESDFVTVTAQLLYQKWCLQAQKCVLVRNAVDAEFFSANVRPNDLLKDVKHPIIGFYGGIAEWIDLDLLAFIAKARPEWNIVLLGDIFVDVSNLERIPNLHLLGRQPYETMPKYLYHFDVCLIPFLKNEITNAVDPVKFYEYISVGKPVVATRVTELLIHEDFLYLAETHDEFVEMIEHALAENDIAMVWKRIGLAKENDWRARVELVKETTMAHVPKISIIVVTYENIELTQLCIESLFRNTTYSNYEIIVVDNASTDGTRNYLRYLTSTYPDKVRIILNKTNLGFAAANNQGIEIATGERIVFLNNDTVLPKGWLWNLNRYLDRPEIGQVGPVSNFVGNEARIDVDYERLDEMEHFAAQYMYAHEGEHFDIKMLALYCVGMRREVIDEIGLLDTAFGIGMFEDDDYSERTKVAGYRVICARDVFVHHFGMSAFKKLLESGDYQKLWDRNEAYFEQKWGQGQKDVSMANNQP